MGGGFGAGEMEMALSVCMAALVSELCSEQLGHQLVKTASQNVANF